MKKSHLSLAVLGAMAAVAHGRTHDDMLTYDAQTVDTAGVYLVNQLEALDRTLNEPLVEITWGRDIDVREDVTIADETSAFTNSSFAQLGSSTGQKNWIGKNSTEIRGLALDIKKTSAPLPLWGMELKWSLPELIAAQKLQRPVDQDQFSAMQTKYQMDVDAQVYIGDDVIGTTGLLNNPGVELMNIAGNWATATPDAILADINNVLREGWKNSGYTIAPANVLVDPINFGHLVGRRLTDTAETVYDFIVRSCISAAKNGKKLVINPCKWLEGRGTDGKPRMVAYTRDKRFVRIPLVPLQRTPVENRGIWQLTNYYGRVGCVELPYEETLIYADEA